MGTPRRSAEGMAIETLSRHIRVYKRGGQPACCLQAMWLMTCGTALRSGEVQVITGQGASIQRTKPCGDAARSSRKRGQQCRDKSQDDD